MKHILNTKLSQGGFAHLMLVAVIVVVGVASVGAYKVVSTSAAVRQNTISVNTEKGCWLAGRKWDASNRGGKCLTKCRNADTKFFKNGAASGYCEGHVWIMDATQRCIIGLNRLYVAEVGGCARKKTQSDGQDQRYCQPGFPYYNADYTNRAEDINGKVDVCEKSKKVANRNEQKGTPGKGSPSQNGSNPNPGQPSSGGNNGNNGNNGGNGNNGNNGNNTVRKVTIRIGAYNAWSVTKSNQYDQVRRIAIGMGKMRDNGAEIVALQELSMSQTSSIRKGAYWAVYRSNMKGDRGLGIAYKRDAFKVIASEDLVIPRAGMDQREPILTLERKKDKARITVMSVHLVSFHYGKRNYEQYQPKQQETIKNKADSLRKRGDTVVLAGDFNWDFSKRKGYMSPYQYRGIRYTNFLAPSDQKISNFKSVNAGAASDHQLIFVDAETTVTSN